MSDPLQSIPEPSFPEHDLLRQAGQLPQLTPGLRDRVMLNCQKQLRYGRWADRFRVTASVIVASLLVLMVWNFRWISPAPQTPQLPQETADQSVPLQTYPYSSPGLVSETTDSAVETDSDGNPLPQGGPSVRRNTIPEMRQLDQLIEKLQNRRDVLCGLLPYL